MTTFTKLFSGVLILLSITTYADTMTKCIDGKGNITFTTLGCKPSEIDVKATEEAKARVEAEAKAKAQTQADEVARRKAVEKVGTASVTSGTKTSSTISSGSTANTSSTTTTSTESTGGGGKTGMRGSIGGDLTTGYQ